jgi:hypothetical protein
LRRRSRAGFNAAFLLIPLAIAAVVAGLIIAYKKVDWFRAAVDAAGVVIKTAAFQLAQEQLEALLVLNPRRAVRARRRW